MYRTGWSFFAYVSSLALLIGCSGSGSTGLPDQNAGAGGAPVGKGGTSSTSTNPAGGSAVGGANATGGLQSSGGKTTGGSSAAGGSQTGGRSSTGGAAGGNAMGGTTSSGSTAGRASGGNAVGGSAAGRSATGGSAVGGSAVGGSAVGGAAAGGKATGGNATGGATAGGSGGTGGKVISYVDLSLNGSQKFMRVVDGKPYWGTEIQVRLDKLTYRRNWNATGRAAIMAQAASDGFNTVGIPISWYEIEPTKDKFDWTILDEYLGLCKKNNLKMEVLWFSQNSGSTVQWLGESYKPVHLRTPDYVLYSPSPGSNATTSEFKKTGAYTLDLKDTNLRTRETYVVAQLMAHIASWDAANGSPHTVIGIQLGNEVYEPYAGDVQVAYYSAVAAAVKSSSYVIWTRMNNWTPHTKDQINANEALRNNGGTNVDFIGDDTYFEGERPDWMTQAVPPIGKNYQMMMEVGADVAIVPQLCLAALSANTAFAYYDMCGPDGHGLYVETGVNTFKPRGSYVDTVRTLNRLLTSDVVDIARLKAQSSSGLFVHNWTGTSSSATTGVRGVSFTPSSSTSQGISIARSSTEIVLMNTLGGTFSYPASLQVSAASRGAFDANNTWVAAGDVTYSGTSITPPAGSTVRLTVAAASP